MKAKGLVVAALVLGGVVSIASRGCFRQPTLAPDERYASHMSSLCEIAREHVKTPEPGVRKLGRYLARHTGDIVKDLADTIALIEMIDDDDKHDDRARVTRERWQRVQCTAAWNEFFDAVQQDSKPPSWSTRGSRA